MEKRYALLLTLLLSVGLPLHAQQQPIKMPFKYALGKSLFDENCSACHGVGLTGTDKGPPLLHAYYKPSHHGDDAFYRAVLHGVKQHHWQFGNMKPVPDMSRRKAKKIISYVRWLQNQNGIK